MILTNMTPQEKLAQIERILPRVQSITDTNMTSAFKVLKRARRHPSYVFCPEKEIAGMGRWTVVLFAESKSNFNKRLISYMAFQKYSVTHSRNPQNNGTGVYLMFPRVEGEVELYEYPPHYFNRLRQRYIAPKGIVQPDFNALVKEAFRINNLCMKYIVQNEYFKENGLYDEARDCGLVRQEGYENFVAYHQCGLSLGISAEDRYFNYTTFVSNDLLRDGQQKMQMQAIENLREHKLALRYDTNATFEENAVLKDADM